MQPTSHPPSYGGRRRRCRVWIGKGAFVPPRLHLPSAPGAGRAAQDGGGERCRGTLGGRRAGKSDGSREGPAGAFEQKVTVLNEGRCLPRTSGPMTQTSHNRMRGMV